MQMQGRFRRLQHRRELEYVVYFILLSVSFRLWIFVLEEHSLLLDSITALLTLILVSFILYRFCKHVVWIQPNNDAEARRQNMRDDTLIALNNRIMLRRLFEEGQGSSNNDSSEERHEADRLRVALRFCALEGQLNEELARLLRRRVYSAHDLLRHQWLQLECNKETSNNDKVDAYSPKETDPNSRNNESAQTLSSHQVAPISGNGFSAFGALSSSSSRSNSLYDLYRGLFPAAISQASASISNYNSANSSIVVSRSNSGLSNFSSSLSDSASTHRSPAAHSSAVAVVHAVDDDDVESGLLTGSSNHNYVDKTANNAIAASATMSATRARALAALHDDDSDLDDDTNRSPNRANNLIRPNLSSSVDSYEAHVVAIGGSGGPEEAGQLVTSIADVSLTVPPSLMHPSASSSVTDRRSDAQAPAPMMPFRFPTMMSQRHRRRRGSNSHSSGSRPGSFLSDVSDPDYRQLVSSTNDNNISSSTINNSTNSATNIGHSDECGHVATPPLSPAHNSVVAPAQICIICLEAFVVAPKRSKGRRRSTHSDRTLHSDAHIEAQSEAQGNPNNNTPHDNTNTNSHNNNNSMDPQDVDHEEEEEIPAASVIVTLPCDHDYHEQCLLQWFARPVPTLVTSNNNSTRQVLTCPLCKQEVVGLLLEVQNAQRLWQQWSTANHPANHPVVDRTNEGIADPAHGAAPINNDTNSVGAHASSLVPSSANSVVGSMLGMFRQSDAEGDGAEEGIRLTATAPVDIEQGTAVDEANERRVSTTSSTGGSSGRGVYNAVITEADIERG